MIILAILGFLIAIDTAYTIWLEYESARSKKS